MELTTISVSADVPGASLVKRFRDFHEQRSLNAQNRLEDIYTQDIEFITPVQRVTGVLALKKYLKSQDKKLQHPTVEFLDVLMGENSAYLTWEMDAKGIRGAKSLRLRGITHIKFTSRIYYHEDCFDLLPLIYGDLPVLNRLTAYLKRMLAA